MPSSSLGSSTSQVVPPPAKEGGSERAAPTASEALSVTSTSYHWQVVCHWQCILQTKEDYQCYSGTRRPMSGGPGDPAITSPRAAYIADVGVPQASDHVCCIVAAVQERVSSFWSPTESHRRDTKGTAVARRSAPGAGRGPLAQVFSEDFKLRRPGAPERRAGWCIFEIAWNCQQCAELQGDAPGQQVETASTGRTWQRYR